MPTPEENLCSLVQLAVAEYADVKFDADVYKYAKLARPGYAWDQFQTTYSETGNEFLAWKGDARPRDREEYLYVVAQFATLTDGYMLAKHNKYPGLK